MRTLLTAFVLCSMTSTLVAQRGAAVGKVEIGAGQGGFGGTLATGDVFGGSIAALGDLDGDGIGDLAVGAPGTDDGGAQRGAVWILRLGADGTVRAQTKISQTSGGFSGNLLDLSRLGARLAPLGDLDGDGVPDLAALVARPARLVVLFLNVDGSVKAHSESSLTSAVFVPPTSQQDFNGTEGFGGLATLGDLDGDGSTDLALGAPYDQDGAGLWTGALWILRLQPSGAIGAAHKISMLHGGFGGTLELGELFGYSLTKLPDLDGDGNPELGVGARDAEEFFWVLFLDANEQVKSERAQLEAELGFGAKELGLLPDLDGDGRGELALGPGFRAGFLANDGSLRTWRNMKRASSVLSGAPSTVDFGLRFADLGDLDADGRPEFAISIPQVEEVWVLTVGTSATRVGSGVNTQSLTQAAPPALGQPWSATLDCAGVGSGLALLVGRARPAAGIFAPAGEVLVGGPLYFRLTTSHVSGPTAFSSSIPTSLALIDLPIFVQGLCQGAPAMRLSNALDLLIDR